jgi:hypothetical protein
MTDPFAVIPQGPVTVAACVGDEGARQQALAAKMGA